MMNGYLDEDGYTFYKQGLNLDKSDVGTIDYVVTGAPLWISSTKMINIGFSLDKNGKISADSKLSGSDYNSMIATLDSMISGALVDAADMISRSCCDEVAVHIVYFDKPNGNWAKWKYKNFWWIKFQKTIIVNKKGTRIESWQKGPYQ